MRSGLADLGSGTNLEVQDSVGVYSRRDDRGFATHPFCRDQRTRICATDLPTYDMRMSVRPGTKVEASYLLGNLLECRIVKRTADERAIRLNNDAILHAIVHDGPLLVERMKLVQR